MDAAEQRAHEERRVLAPHLAVDRVAERPPHEIGVAKAGQGEEIPLLLLGVRAARKRSQNSAYSASPPLAATMAMSAGSTFASTAPSPARCRA